MNVTLTLTADEADMLVNVLGRAILSLPKSDEEDALLCDVQDAVADAVEAAR